MPSDPVPLVKRFAVELYESQLQARPLAAVYDRSKYVYLAEAVDVALAAKDETIAALQQELGERDKFRDEIYKPQLALLREQLTTWEALWAEVGQHIDRAAIGYNHPQICAVFTENRRLSAELAAVRQQLADAQREIRIQEKTAFIAIGERDAAEEALAATQAELGALRARLAHLETVDLSEANHLCDRCGHQWVGADAYESCPRCESGKTRIRSRRS